MLPSLQVVWHHEGEGGGDAEVSDEDEEEGGADGDGDRALRVLRLLPARGDGVEAHVAVETAKLESLDSDKLDLWSFQISKAFDKSTLVLSVPSGGAGQGAVEAVGEEAA